MSVLWLFGAYSFAFTDGGDLNKYIGSITEKFLFNNVEWNALSGTIPENVFFIFQMTFAIITPALMVGAYVERIKFSAVLLISAIWLFVVYAPATHWVWGFGSRREGCELRPGFVGACAGHAARTFHTNIPPHRVVAGGSFAFHPRWNVGRLRPNALHHRPRPRLARPRFQLGLRQRAAWGGDHDLAPRHRHVDPSLDPTGAAL